MSMGIILSSEWGSPDMEVAVNETRTRQFMSSILSGRNTMVNVTDCPKCAAVVEFELIT